jgi:predicted permease
VNEFLRRIRYLLNRRRFDQELTNDMEFHREMAARNGGVGFGSSLRLREESREAWGWTWIDRSAQDVRYAARMLRKSPGFTVAAVLMLGVGIGVNVAAFSFFNLLVLKPMSVREPDTLLRFKRRSPQSYASGFPYPEMAFFRENSRTLSSMLALNETNLTMEGAEKPVNASFVTCNFFNEVGASMELGRAIDPARDGAPGAEPVAVLSEGFWQRRFGGDPAIAGKTIRLNGKPATVIGVASSGFSGLSMNSPDLWSPISQQLYFVTGSNLLNDYSVDGSGVKVWGRLQPGVSRQAAESELASLAAELRKQHPNDIWENERIPSEPGAYAAGIQGSHHGTGREDRNEVIPIAALVGSLALLILVVACGNLGSLLLARGVAREREITIRVAVGAGSGRLIRQLFTESLLLALLGSAAGLGLGYVVLRSLMALTETPAWLNPAPDWRVIVFAIGIGFAAAILFGLTPALQVARQQHRATKMRQVLIGAQVAGSCVLLILAGLLVRALGHAVSTHPGFEYEQVVSVDPGLSAHGYVAADARVYLEALKNRLLGLPGIESVSMASTPPLGRKKTSIGANVDGRRTEIRVNNIDPQFFQTMKVPLLRGRNLMRGDTRAIVVSESLARFIWPTEDPLGKTFDSGDVKYTVIGVVGNARMTALQDGDSTEAYFLAQDADLPSMALQVRAAGPPEGLVPFLASAAKSIDPKVFPEVQLLKGSYRRRMEGAEYSALAVSLLGFVALLLACLGIVGLLAYAVSQRTKEIGIRMALGAEPAHIVSVVLRQLSRPVVVGLLVGVGGAAALSQLLRRELYGVSNLDPITYVAAVAVFVASIAAAALLPARRALRVDPIQALRQD